MKRKFTKQPVKASNPLLTPQETKDAILNERPFDLASFKQLHYNDDDYSDGIQAESVEVGDIISIDYSQDQLNIGVVVEVLDVVEEDYGGREDDIELIFTVKVVEGDRRTKEGSTHTIRYYLDEWVGHVIS